MDTWTNNEDIISSLVEVTLEDPDSFLKVKETLTRIGIPSFKTKTLFQSTHILHKRGRYYIVHFKELFAIDGKPTNITEEDIGRRNMIVKMLVDWGLLTTVNPIDTEHINSNVKVISYNDKMNWNLVPKYSIGIRH